MNFTLTQKGIASLYKGHKEELSLQVLSVHRYFIDAYFLAITELTVNVDDVYDIVLSDGVTKTKCLLAPSLAIVPQLIPQLLQKCVLVVKDWKVRRNETIIGAAPYVTIVDFDIYSGISGIVCYSFKNDEPQLPQWYRPEDGKKADKPLIGGRGFYIHPLADDTPSDTRWCTISEKFARNYSVDGNSGNTISKKRNSRNIISGSRNSGNTGSEYTGDENSGPEKEEKPSAYFHCQQLAELYQNKQDELVMISEIFAKQNSAKKSRTMSRTFILARVMKKSRLTCFAKKDDKQKYPLYFTVIVQDSSGKINITLWNSLCALYFGKINVGDVILIRNFTIKNAYNPSEDYELGLNPSNPRGTVQIVVGDVDQMVNLPRYHLNFGNLEKIFSQKIPAKNNSKGNNIPEGTEFDICGMVTFLSDPFRVKSFEKYFLVRWARVFDQSGAEISVKIFMNSQLRPFTQLQIGDPILLTNMMVHQGPPEPYLVSTAFTQLYHGIQLTDFSQDPEGKLHQLVDWVSGIDPSPYLLMDEHVMCFKSLYIPPSPITSLETPSDIVLVRELPVVCATMQYQERRFIFIQGYITNITAEQVTKLSLVYYRTNIEDANREVQMTATIPCFPLFAYSEKLRKRKAENRNRLKSISTIFRNNFNAKERAYNLTQFIPVKGPIGGKAVTESSVINQVLNLIQRQLFLIGLDIYSPTGNPQEVEIVISSLSRVTLRTKK